MRPPAAPTTEFTERSSGWFQTRISYAFVQQAVDIRPNRTGIDSRSDTS